MSHPSHPNGRFLYHLRAHLRRGGLIAYPTESSYGLGCLPQNALAVSRLIALKKRPQHKGLIVIAADYAQLKPMLQPISVDELAAINLQWPAATTLLLPVHQRTLPILRGLKRDTLAVRIPALLSARFLCRIIGSAVVSTSCNRAGKKACRTQREVRRQFGDKVLILGGRTGGHKQPSQIIDWRSGNRIR
jgi:L-threonylcarbamoyladenylate synthase